MKKVVSILTVAALLLTPALAFAEDEAVVTVAEETVEDVVATDYDKQIVTGNIASVEENQYLVKTDADEIAINVDEDTLFVNGNAEKITAEAVKEGVKVSIVADAAMTKSIPAQSYGYIVMVAETEDEVLPFYAEIAEVTDEEEAVKLSTKDGQYEVRITDETVVTNMDGEKVEAVNAGDVVLFTTPILTLSIPAQATAEKVVVVAKEETDVIIDEGTVEVAEADEIVISGTDKVMVNGKEVETKVIVGDATLLHVRAICEAMGLEVAWNADDKSVTVGTIPMGVSFKLDENSYNKAKMTPFELSAAPTLIDEMTYVPVEFFTTVLEANVVFEN